MEALTITFAAVGLAILASWGAAAWDRRAADRQMSGLRQAVALSENDRDKDRNEFYHRLNLPDTPDTLRLDSEELTATSPKSELTNA
jgi:hypothetical protein